MVQSPSSYLTLLSFPFPGVTEGAEEAGVAAPVHRARRLRHHPRGQARPPCLARIRCGLRGCHAAPQLFHHGAGEIAFPLGSRVSGLCGGGNGELRRVREGRVNVDEKKRENVKRKRELNEGGHHWHKSFFANKVGCVLLYIYMIIMMNY